MTTTVLDRPVVIDKRHATTSGPAAIDAYVVVGITDSCAAVDALAAAVDEARDRSATLVIVAVDEGVNRSLLAAGAPFLVPFHVLRDAASSVIQDRLVNALETARRGGVRCVPVWRSGAPADVLADVVRAYHAELVVVGRPSCSARARARRFLSGRSVHAAVLRQRTGAAVLCP